ncbi:MAG: site-specific integrase, partial [Dehalococcoidia bacterium]
LVDPPRSCQPEITTLSREQARALLSAARHDRFEALYVLALTTGMRQGELLALRWRDIDLDTCCLNVRGSLQRSTLGLAIGDPKTRKSRRRIELSAAAVEALSRHQQQQERERLDQGPAWQEQGLVFANELGRPMEAGNLVRRSFRPLLRAAGLPRIRFHDLRHTAATLLMGQNVPPKVVSEMLGHSQVGITLDLYSHVTPTMQRQATAAMDALLQP